MSVALWHKMTAENGNSTGNSSPLSLCLPQTSPVLTDLMKIWQLVVLKYGPKLSSNVHTACISYQQESLTKSRKVNGY